MAEAQFKIAKLLKRTDNAERLDSGDITEVTFTLEVIQQAAFEDEQVSFNSFYYY